jgi:hypothetical protein
MANKAMPTNGAQGATGETSGLRADYPIEQIRGLENIFEGMEGLVTGMQQMLKGVRAVLQNYQVRDPYQRGKVVLLRAGQTTQPQVPGPVKGSPE